MARPQNNATTNTPHLAQRRCGCVRHSALDRRANRDLPNRCPRSRPGRPRLRRRFQGRGAHLQGDFDLQAGDIIKILVGQKGGDSLRVGGAGGGTSSCEKTTPVPEAPTHDGDNDRPTVVRI